MSIAKERGRQGEALVAEYLQKRGYTILARNYTVRGGEIDLIAEDDRVLAFVEVKTRTESQASARYGRPSRAVDRSKWTHIRFAAEKYLREHPTHKAPRLDVAEVYFTPLADGGVGVQIRYYPAAARDR